MVASRGTQGSDGLPCPARASRHALGVDLMLAAVVLLLAVPVVEPLMAQQASRLALTAALVDHQTVAVDRYAASLTVDRAEHDGRLYSDKAPGQPFLAVPAYAAYRLAGGQPAEVHQAWGNTGLWAVSTWSAALPAALLVVLMRRGARRVSPASATPAALAMATATMLLPFATVLFSHVLSGLLLFASFLLARDPPPRAWAPAAAGFLAALAVAVEYSAVLAWPVLLAVAVSQSRWRAGWFVLAGALPAAGVAVYHWAAFGNPLAFPYAYSYFAEVGGGVTAPVPSAGMLAQVLVGERGLLVLTPVVAVGIAGLVLLARDRRRRLDAVAALLVVGLFVALMAGWTNPTGGASPGPRYVVPALPFLVFGVAKAWRQWPVVAWASAGVGAVTMALATFTMPLAPRAELALSWWAERLASGRIADVIVPGGPWAIVAALAGATVLAACAVRLDRARRPVHVADG